MQGDTNDSPQENRDKNTFGKGFALLIRFENPP
ncbi:Uncharacterised protein [Shigella flexneri]|uniref:Uncharacterized protein n=1 Tax=Shigella flexneri TaxID=623 RepID=A0A380AVY3_SHIFL|nr:Uncharacterised protein [Shigella flexneri]SUI87730.1 Uncharacterised protein [Shigella flexneri]